MCGIAGILALDGVDPRTLMAMTHMVSYRGPDAFGFAYAGRGHGTAVEVIHDQNRLPVTGSPVIGLGSRRLAILDVSRGGNMPMRTEDGAYCVTFNGEIYNYKELRCGLEQRGHRFRTQTDTEVILRSYQEWGEQCLERFNGMWGFALWDHPRRRLFCARDRFGVKPFYYTVHAGRFYFGSEIKQILLASSIPRVAKTQAVSHFLEWGLVDHSADTFFENIYQLPGGHWLRIDLSDSLRPVIGRFWELRVTPPSNPPVEKAVQEFQDRFRNAVKLRLRSDVPVGFSLSGGLDSSAVLCQAKTLASEQQFHTFSACFDDPLLDERRYVGVATEAAGAVSHLVFAQPEGFWRTFETMICHHDEPILSTGAFAQWSVMQEARRHGIPVILGGQGADESLCGYQKYRFFYLWELLREVNPAVFWQASTWLLNGTRYYWTPDSVARYLPDALRSRFSLTKRVGTTDLWGHCRQNRPSLGPSRGLAERQKKDLVYASIPALVHAEDRNSMAHSVESRLPFLDYELVEFAVNCPPSLKLRGPWSKWLLRHALSGQLPEAIRLRKTKLGFDTPENVWVRAGLQNGHRDLWGQPKLRMERFLRPDFLARECSDFLQGRPGALAPALIFRAVSLEQWARSFQVS